MFVARSLLVSPLLFSVLPHVDWALWLCCLQGHREKRETLMSSAKWAQGYRQADGAAIGSVHIHTHTHTRVQNCMKVTSRTYNQTHTCSCLVCRPCQCFSMSLGQARCIYYVLSETVLIYHRKNSPVSGNTEWHPARPDEWDLHTQVEQIKKRLRGALTFSARGCTVIKKKSPPTRGNSQGAIYPAGLWELPTTLHTGLGQIQQNFKMQTLLLCHLIS